MEDIEQRPDANCYQRTMMISISRSLYLLLFLTLIFVLLTGPLPAQSQLQSQLQSPYQAPAANPIPINSIPTNSIRALLASVSASDDLTGVYVLEKGEESLLARAALVEMASDTIDIQYFIWSTDNIGTLATEALLRAADRGVRVRVIVDDVVIDANDTTMLAIAAHPNVQIKIYNPRHQVGVSWWKRLWYLVTEFRSANQRMHDKTVIYDQSVAITGGRNMADEYYDYDHAYNFRDRDVLLAGNAVAEVDASFTRFWQSPLSVPIEQLLTDVQQALSPAAVDSYRQWLSAYAADTDNFADEVRTVLADLEQGFAALASELRWARVQFISDLPGKNPGQKGLAGGGRSTDKLVELLEQAQHSITIQTPYLVLPDGGLALFAGLVNQGIDVRIVTNSLASTDNLQAFSGYHKQRDEILAAGIKVYEYRPRPDVSRALIERYEALEKSAPIFALHAKTLVVDGEQLVIGTFNLDPRSANLNTEVGALIIDPQIAAEVEQAIAIDMLPENSWDPNVDNPDQAAGWWKRIKLAFWKLFPLDPIL